MPPPFHDTPGRARRRRLALAAAVAGVLALTLMPVASAVPGPHFVLELSGLRMAADAVVNILLFMPLGVAAALSLAPRRAVAFGAALSVLIEVVQLVVPGRFTSPTDVLFNTTGTAAGVLLLTRWRVWLQPFPVVRRTLGMAAALLAAAVVAAGSVLFGMSVPDERLHAQWTPELEGMQVYDGEVLASSIGGMPVRSRRIRDSAQARGALLAGDTVAVVFRPGAPTSAAAPIFSVQDPRAREVLLLAADGPDLIVRYRMRAAAARLDHPDFVLDHVLDGIDTLAATTLRVWRDGASVCASVDTARRCDPGPPAARTWALLLYPVPRPLVTLLDGIWLAALLLPAGFWSRSIVGTGTRALLFCAALALSPRFAPVPSAHPLHYAAALAGAFGGRSVAAAIARRTEAERADRMQL